MYNELQLRFIERFGRKDLELGLIIRGGGGGIYKVNDADKESGTYRLLDRHGRCSIKGLLKEGGKILGHEPHLFPDVARVMKEYGLGMQMFSDADIIEIYEGSRDNMIKDIPYNFTIPLLSQPEVMSQLLEIFKK